MLKKTLIVLTLPLLSVLAISVTTRLPASPEPREGGWSVVSSQAASQTARSPQRAGSAVATAPDTGTLQKVIVENGSVTLNLDLNQLNGISHGTQNLQQVHFAVAANSFFPILIFNDLFRGIEPGSMTLIPTGAIPVEAALNAFGAAGTSVSQATRLPLQLRASLNRLTVEKLASGQGFDLAIRDSNTGFAFFNLQGAAVRLRPRRAVAYHHEWQTAPLKRVCQSTWPAISRWFISRNNRYRRDDATDSDHPDC